MQFREIGVNEITGNVFERIGKQWMLITAGDVNHCNTMTASWGGVGIMWGKPVATAYIRQSRYTKEFVDREQYFTISFLPEEYREALNLCGTVSGRERDKIKEAGLTAVDVDETTAFAEAELVFVCRKVFHQTMEPMCFDEPENLKKWYGDQDYHTMYMGEIVKILAKEV